MKLLLKKKILLEQDKESIKKKWDGEIASRFDNTMSNNRLLFETDKIITKINQLCSFIIDDFKKTQDPFFVFLVLSKGPSIAIFKMQALFEEKLDQILTEMDKIPQDRLLIAKLIRFIIEFKAYYDANPHNQNDSIKIKISKLQDKLKDDLMKTKDLKWIRALSLNFHLFGLEESASAKEFIQSKELINLAKHILDDLIQEIKTIPFIKRLEMARKILNSLKIIGIISGSISNTQIPDNFFVIFLKLIKKISFKQKNLIF